MHFKVLGPLEVVQHGRTLRLGGPRQRAVLARLLVAHPHPVGRDQLIDDVWSGEPPVTAAKTMQKYVSELRKVLGAEVVRTVGAGYAIDVDDAHVDAVRFEELVDAAQFEDALALWRGDPLADLADLAFTTPYRTRLGELRMFALERIVDEHLACERYADAIALASQLVDEYPLHERFCAQRMLALYRSGRPVDALRTYESHRRELAESGLMPSNALRALESAVVRHDETLQAASDDDIDVAPGNIRRPLDAFIGRTDEQLALIKALDENRLVTLTGPGGVGKTRLALEVLADTAHEYAGGAWFVDLAALSSPGLVAHSVATALGLTDQRDQTDEETIAAALCQRRAVLLLDNCEHVADACAVFAERVLGACREVRVLATSRRPLGTSCEFVAPLGPLDDASAAQLFAERARCAGHAPASDEDEVVQVRELCQALDGLPLAIELCASQLRVLGTAGMLARLEDRLQFPGRQPSAPARHRTLRDLVEWSHELLEPATQRIFARLGVFAATFSLCSAEAVCDDPDTLAHIGILVDHSMLVPEPDALATNRYRMLDTLRLFALERLVAIGELDNMRRAHAENFIRIARASVGSFYGPDEIEWANRLKAEEPNIHAALCWGRDNDPTLALNLAVNLWPYWEFRWRERQALDYLDPILECPHLAVPEATKAWALTVAADLGANPGAARVAIRRAEEAASSFRARDDKVGLACALVALGWACRNQGSLDRALAALDEALVLTARLDIPMLAGRALCHRSNIAMQRGDYHAAVRDITEALARARDVGSTRGEALALRQLAVAHWHLGELDRASETCMHALELWRENGDEIAAAHTRITIADIAVTRGDLDYAQGIYEQALRVVRAVGDRRCTASTQKNLAVIAARRGDHASSVALLTNAIDARYELGDDAGLAECLEALAECLAARGWAEDAAVLLGAAQRRRDHTGSVRSPHQAGETISLVSELQTELGPPRFGAAHAQGTSLGVDEAFEYALACAQ